MSKYIDADQIRKEIERRMDKHWDLLPNADSPEDDWTHNELCELGAFKELEHLEQFLDTLPEQPVLPGIDEEGIPGKDFIPVEWVDACERYGKWKIVSAEQPVEGLEEEIKRMVYDVVYDLDGPAIKGTSEYLSVEDVASIARHFAEWGAEHLKR